jgi:hypothetical protein
MGRLAGGVPINGVSLFADTSLASLRMQRTTSNVTGSERHGRGDRAGAAVSWSGQILAPRPVTVRSNQRYISL